MLKDRLSNLTKPFNVEWVSEFHRFMKMIDDSPEATQLVEGFQNKKIEDSEALLQALEVLFEEVGLTCQSVSEKAAAFPQIATDIQNNINRISSFAIPKDISSPFFDPVRLLYDYASSLRELTEKLIQHGKVELTTLWGALFCPLNVSGASGRDVVDIRYTFSGSIDKCQAEADRFRGKRDIAYWRKWDILLQWREWLKNGLPNQAFHENKRNSFNHYKVGNTVQSIGLYFLEHLETKAQAVEKISVEALELFLDGNNQYWVVIHAVGKGDGRRPYFIKTLRSPDLLSFFKKLMKTDSHTEIEWNAKTSHHLGELMIKGEMLKVFFPTSRKFSGAYVKLSSLSVSIDVQLILDELASAQTEKKRIPEFNHGEYFKQSIRFQRHHP